MTKQDLKSELRMIELEIKNLELKYKDFPKTSAPFLVVAEYKRRRKEVKRQMREKGMFLTQS